VSSSSEKQLIVQNLTQEIQPARDPNLCYWAEWYYLLLVASFLETGSLGENIPHLISIFYPENASQNEKAIAVEKVAAADLMYVVDGQDKWLSPRRFKLGARTALVVRGALTGMVLIPQPDNKFVIGRPLGAGFETAAGFDQHYKKKLHNDPNDVMAEMITAGNQRINRVKKPGETHQAFFERGVAELAQALERTLHV
jgi:hypothetical protein